MVHVSKKYINENVLERIYELFFEILIRSARKELFFEVINELYSPSERIMFAKRVCIIYLLSKNIDQRTIAKTTKVSTGTVSRYSVMFHKKESALIKILDKLVKKEAISQFLDDMLAGLLIQPGYKIGHWELYWARERKKQFKRSTGL